MKKCLKLYGCLITAIFLLSNYAYAAEKVFFYYTDPAGTPLAMTDQSGNVVWRTDNKPFGEVQSTTGSVENNKQFIGKEKDKETGLHNIGVRYMKDEIGRFISPDPVGPVNPLNSKTNYGMLKNPQLLNRYAYSLNNPFRYKDTNGAWSEDVHSGIGRSDYGTYKWAKDVGLSEKDARRLAVGNNATDNSVYSGWLPVFGDQSRHFNEAHDGTDTRDKWANIELKRAEEYEKAGDHKAALGHLGKGLHSLQDKYAHRDWDTGPAGAEAHPGWYDKWNDSRNSAAAEATERATKIYLDQFIMDTR